MEIINLLLHPLRTNCYIVGTNEKNAVVIDPAHEAKKIRQELEKNGLTMKKILLTHGHFDHVEAVADLIEGNDTPVYIHTNDVELLTDGTKALAFFCPEVEFKPINKNVVVLNDGDTVELDGIKFNVMHTPGHTAGSVCYLTEDENGEKIMFAGDTIFKDSIGRCDGYSGDYIVQQETLRKLIELPDDYKIFSGHGGPTRLSVEKRYNPFIMEL